MSVCILMIDGCGDEIITYKQQDVEEWQLSHNDIKCKLEGRMKIANIVNEILQSM